MVNDVPESPNENDDFDCLNPVSSWRCGDVDCGVQIVLRIHCKSEKNVPSLLLITGQPFIIS
jgi:hypothetical protein